MRHPVETFRKGVRKSRGRIVDPGDEDTHTGIDPLVAEGDDQVVAFLEFQKLPEVLDFVLIITIGHTDVLGPAGRNGGPWSPGSVAPHRVHMLKSSAGERILASLASLAQRRRAPRPRPAKRSEQTASLEPV
jgi:hypothetical protein